MMASTDAVKDMTCTEQSHGGLGGDDGPRIDLEHTSLCGVSVH
jgi:hypothetical protein